MTYWSTCAQEKQGGSKRKIEQNKIAEKKGEGRGGEEKEKEESKGKRKKRVLIKNRARDIEFFDCYQDFLCLSQ